MPGAAGTWRPRRLRLRFVEHDGADDVIVPRQHRGCDATAEERRQRARARPAEEHCPGLRFWR